VGAADNVILITLDGARVQEMFGGLDLEILRSTLKKGQTVEDRPVYRRFWAAEAVARREKLMPFFWKTLMSEHGSIAGNRMLGSTVRVTNRHRFSYPGYSEILVGEAHDEAITSNDPIRNPNRTVLETVRERLGLPSARVATVASWSQTEPPTDRIGSCFFVVWSCGGPSGPRYTLSRKRRTFSRLPQVFMSHHRRARFFVVSRNSQAHVAAAQVRTRSSSGETSRSTADRTTGVSGAARSPSSTSAVSVKRSSEATSRERSNAAGSAALTMARSGVRGERPVATAANTR
jgi:hypothetical protein